MARTVWGMRPCCPQKVAICRDEQLASIVDSNPGIFSEEDIGGVLTYYCPGSKYDWFDCYAMVIEDKLFVVNIEKGYDKYIEDVLSNIVLQ